MCGTLRASGRPAAPEPPNQNPKHAKTRHKAGHEHPAEPGGTVCLTTAVSPNSGPRRKPYPCPILAVGMLVPAPDRPTQPAPAPAEFHHFRGRVPTCSTRGCLTQDQTRQTRYRRRTVRRIGEPRGGSHRIGATASTRRPGRQAGICLLLQKLAGTVISSPAAPTIPCLTGKASAASASRAGISSSRSSGTMKLAEHCLAGRLQAAAAGRDEGLFLDQIEHTALSPYFSWNGLM